jgi:hypothetical protein
MADDFGIGPVEVIVFLSIAAIVWGLCALTSLTKTRR